MDDLSPMLIFLFWSGVCRLIRFHQAIAHAAAAAFIPNEDAAIDQILDIAQRSVFGGLNDLRVFRGGEFALETI